MNGDFSSTVTNGALTLGTTVVGNAVGDDFTAAAVGIAGGPLTVTGATTLNGGTGNVTLTGANDFGTSVSVGSSANTSLFVSGSDLPILGSVQATQNFALATDAATLTLPTATVAASQLSTGQIRNFNVGSLSLTAGSIAVNNTFNFPNIQTLALNSTTGAITASAAVTVFSLSLNSATSATLSAGNRIANLGSVRTSSGNFTLVNVQGMNLAGSVSVAGTADLTVAGQLYNYSGQATPFAGTTGRAVVRSLSMMGGLPNQISALAGFTPSYNFTDPGTSRAMIYAVSPLAQTAPSGTSIAGVDLGGTQTGGGQFNTFLTGSDNLNWIISDFGKFNLPKVEPARMEYMLYPQRIDPETKTLPQPLLGELTKALGRPPTIEEIQAREVANRSMTRMRTGVILDRSSFDDDEATPAQKEANTRAPMIDGRKPQAAHQPSSEGAEARKDGSPISKNGASSTLRGTSPGPIMRTTPAKIFALRNDSSDADTILKDERERAEVGSAIPVAGSR
jgi:hypothetical protein